MGEIAVDAVKLIDELQRYRSKLEAFRNQITSDESAEYEELMNIVSSSLLRSFISNSKTVMKEYGDTLYSTLTEDLSNENRRAVLFHVAAFVYEGVLNGAMTDDTLSILLTRLFIPSVTKTNDDNLHTLLFPRISLLVSKDKYQELSLDLSKQKNEIEGYANAATAKAKETFETLTGADENLKEYLKKAAGLKGELGFLVLSKAFTSFIETKEKEIGRLSVNLKSMGMFLLVIPILTFCIYQALPLFSKSKLATPAVQAGYSTVKGKEVNIHKETATTDSNKNSGTSSGTDWTGIVNRLLNLLPVAVAELILLFYFRIILANYNATNAQLLQLKMRQSACQFIQDYISFKKENGVEEIEKFDALIFSNLMPSAEQIPATFEGLEHLGKILSEFKPGKKD